MRPLLPYRVSTSPLPSLTALSRAMILSMRVCKSIFADRQYEDGQYVDRQYISVSKTSLKRLALLLALEGLIIGSSYAATEVMSTAPAAEQGSANLLAQPARVNGIATGSTDINNGGDDSQDEVPEDDGADDFFNDGSVSFDSAITAINDSNGGNGVNGIKATEQIPTNQSLKNSDALTSASSGVKATLPKNPAPQVSSIKTPDTSNQWTTDNGVQSVSNNAPAAANSTTQITAKLPNISDPISQIPLNAISPMTLKTFVEVIDLVRREYVDPVSDEVMFNDAMSGMLTKLDSHAEFLDAEAYENLRAFTQGDVGEVGLQAQYDATLGHWVVTAVTAGSPAANERIKVGDYIHQINETKLTDAKTPNDIEQMLSGIAGTQVEVVVSSAGRRKRTVTLQRNQTREQEVRARLQEGIALIKLPVFQNNSREKILTALAGLDAPISGIIIDVRDNPGGVLESAVDIAGIFMADTEVVKIKGRRGVMRTLKTSPGAPLTNMPIMILQNRYSASAAEVLASSLQMAKRAKVVGETSYGKGSVQSVIPINDEQAIKLTVAHYLTADGRTIDDIGVDPDIRLQGEESTWEMQALRLLQANKLPEGVKIVLK